MIYTKEQEKLLDYFWGNIISPKEIYNNKRKDKYIILSKETKKLSGTNRSYLKIFHEACGSIFEVRADNWSTYSNCSCLTKNRSAGEDIIFKTLTDLLKYKKNYFFEEQFKICKNPKTNNWLRMDFAIKDKWNNVLLFIEYDGSQHYKETPYFHRTETSFKDSKYRDFIKEEYAKKYFNAPVIRFLDPTSLSSKIKLLDSIPNKLEKILKQYLK
jgi:hypothetical protein